MSIPIPILIALILLVMLLGAIYAFGITKRWGILLPFMGMVLFGSMALPVNWYNQVNPTVWLPIQSQRSALYLASGMAGMLVVLFQINRLGGKRIAISAMLLLLVGLYGAFLRFFHIGPADGAMSVAFTLTTLLPLLMTAALFIQKPDDLRMMMRSLVAVNIVWVAMSAVQIVVNPKFVTMGNEFRFIGLLSNPQHSGVLMAFFTVISLWMLLNESRRFTLILMGLVGINGLLLMWTGSRTGLGMAIIGVSATLYSRVGRAILFLPVAAILGYVGFKIMVNVLNIDLGFERLVSTNNTRDDAWRTLIEVAQSNIILGAGTDDAINSENSWLYGFASYGIGMLLLLLILAFVGTIEILKSMRARFLVEPKQRNTLDFLIGVLLMYFAGAVLEGYMIARVSSTLCVFMVFAVANVNIRRMLLAQRYEHQEHGYDEYDESYEQYGDYQDYGDYPDEHSDEYTDEQPGYAS